MAYTEIYGKSRHFCRVFNDPNFPQRKNLLAFASFNDFEKDAEVKILTSSGEIKHGYVRKNTYEKNNICEIIFTRKVFIYIPTTKRATDPEYDLNRRKNMSDWKNDYTYVAEENITDSEFGIYTTLGSVWNLKDENKLTTELKVGDVIEKNELLNLNCDPRLNVTGIPSSFDSVYNKIILTVKEINLEPETITKEKEMCHIEVDDHDSYILDFGLVAQG